MMCKKVLIIGALVNLTLSTINLVLTGYLHEMTATVGVMLMWMAISIRSNQ
jgi:hypothetical protein